MTKVRVKQTIYSLVLLVLCVLLVACGGSGDATPTPAADEKGDVWVICPGNIMNNFIVCRECTIADTSGTPRAGCVFVEK